MVYYKGGQRTSNGRFEARVMIIVGRGLTLISGDLGGCGRGEHNSMVPVFRKDVEPERTEWDEMKGNVQSHTLLRFGTAERLSAGSHDRGDAVLFGQVRRIVLLTACKANRDHYLGDVKSLCGVGSGF